MEQDTEGQEPQKTPEEVIAELQAKVAELEPKATASSQNYERLKKIESEKKELEVKLAEKGETTGLDPAKFKQEIDEKVDLRLAGFDSEHIEEIERYAKGAGLSLAEAAKSPFIVKAVEGLRAEKKSTDSTPAPSSKIRTFNGKPVEEVFKSGSEAEKQAAWEQRLSGGVKNSE